jgi:hypothetical protein
MTTTVRHPTEVEYAEMDLIRFPFLRNSGEEPTKTKVKTRRKIAVPFTWRGHTGRAAVVQMRRHQSGACTKERIKQALTEWVKTGAFSDGEGE